MTKKISVDEAALLFGVEPKDLKVGMSFPWGNETYKLESLEERNAVLSRTAESLTDVKKYPHDYPGLFHELDYFSGKPDITQNPEMNAGNPVQAEAVDQEELDAVERWIHESVSTLAIKDWEWDGKKLKVFTPSGGVETYTRKDLEEEGVLKKKTKAAEDLKVGDKVQADGIDKGEIIKVVEYTDIPLREGEPVTFYQCKTPEGKIEEYTAEELKKVSSQTANCDCPLCLGKVSSTRDLNRLELKKHWDLVGAKEFAEVGRRNYEWIMGKTAKTDISPYSFRGTEVMEKNVVFPGPELKQEHPSGPINNPQDLGSEVFAAEKTHWSNKAYNKDKSIMITWDLYWLAQYQSAYTDIVVWKDGKVINSYQVQGEDEGYEVFDKEKEKYNAKEVGKRSSLKTAKKFMIETRTREIDDLVTEKEFTGTTLEVVDQALSDYKAMDVDAQSKWYIAVSETTDPLKIPIYTVKQGSLDKQSVEKFDITNWREENPGKNPNMNKVLKTNLEMLNHAWLQLRLLSEGGVVVNIEPYDRELSQKDYKNIYNYLRKNEDKILSMFDNVSYLEIDTLGQYVGASLNVEAYKYKATDITWYDLKTDKKIKDDLPTEVRFPDIIVERYFTRMNDHVLFTYLINRFKARPSFKFVQGAIEIQSYIRKLPSGEYRVYSEKGRNMGTYDTKEEAKKRLQQIEYFKHKGAKKKLKVICKNCGEEMDYADDASRYFREVPDAWTCSFCGYTTESEENPKTVMAELDKEAVTQKVFKIDFDDKTKKEFGINGIIMKNSGQSNKSDEEFLKSLIDPINIWYDISENLFPFPPKKDEPTFLKFKEKIDKYAKIFSKANGKVVTMDIDKAGNYAVFDQNTEPENEEAKNMGKKSNKEARKVTVAPKGVPDKCPECGELEIGRNLENNEAYCPEGHKWIATIKKEADDVIIDTVNVYDNGVLKFKHKEKNKGEEVEETKEEEKEVEASMDIEFDNGVIFKDKEGKVLFAFDVNSLTDSEISHYVDKDKEYFKAIGKEIIVNAKEKVEKKDKKMTKKFKVYDRVNLTDEDFPGTIIDINDEKFPDIDIIVLWDEKLHDHDITEVHPHEIEFKDEELTKEMKEIADKAIEKFIEKDKDRKKKFDKKIEKEVKKDIEEEVERESFIFGQIANGNLNVGYIVDSIKDEVKAGLETSVEDYYPEIEHQIIRMAEFHYPDMIIDYNMHKMSYLKIVRKHIDKVLEKK